MSSDTLAGKHARARNLEPAIHITTISSFAVLVMVGVTIALLTSTVIEVLPDEMRYLDVARSLAHGGPLAVSGFPSDYQKIGYPLAILPAMLATDDTLMQLRIIQVINALWVASAVFPLYLIAKRTGASAKTRLIIAFTAPFLISPGTIFSFMSESVYIPLMLWFIYAAWKMLDADDVPLIYSFTLGLFAYAIYLVKELGVIPFGVFLAMVTYHAIRKRTSWKMACKLVLPSLAAFALCFCALKLTVFEGMGNSYDQFGEDSLTNPYALLFGLLWALPRDASIVAFCFSGVFLVIPLVERMGMSEHSRTLVTLVFASIVVLALVCTWSIGMIEDLGEAGGRIQFRYYTPLHIIAVVLTLYALLDCPHLEWSRRDLVLHTVLATLVCAGMLMFAGQMVSSTFGDVNDLMLTIADETLEPSDGLSPANDRPLMTLHPAGVLIAAIYSLFVLGYFLTRRSDARPHITHVYRTMFTALTVAVMFTGAFTHACMMLDANRMTTDDAQQIQSFLDRVLDETQDGELAITAPWLDEGTTTSSYPDDISDVTSLRTLATIAYVDNTTSRYFLANPRGDKLEHLFDSERTYPVTDFDYVLCTPKIDSIDLPDGSELVDELDLSLDHDDDGSPILKWQLYSTGRL